MLGEAGWPSAMCSSQTVFVGFWVTVSLVRRPSQGSRLIIVFLCWPPLGQRHVLGATSTGWHHQGTDV